MRRELAQHAHSGPTLDMDRTHSLTHLDQQYSYTHVVRSASSEYMSSQARGTSGVPSKQYFWGLKQTLFLGSQANTVSGVPNTRYFLGVGPKQTLLLGIGVVVYTGKRYA